MPRSHDWQPSHGPGWQNSRQACWHFRTARQQSPHELKGRLGSSSMTPKLLLHPLVTKGRLVDAHLSSRGPRLTACLNGRPSIFVPTRWALPLLPKTNKRNLLFAASTPTSAVHNALVVVDTPTAIAVPDLTLTIDSFKAYSALVATVVNILLYLLAERCAGSWFLPSFIFGRAHCVQRNGRHFCPAGSFLLA